MLVSDLVTVAVAGKDGLEYARDFVDDKRGCAELDAFEQRFADILQKAVKNTLPSDVVKETFEQKHKQILSTLENIDISDANSAPLRLCDEITNQIINELDIDSIDGDEIQEAVETAYRAALDEFLDEMPDRDVDRWLLESSKDTQKKLGNIDNRLQELRTDLSYRDDLMGRIEPFERIDPTTDDWVDRVAVELGVEAERELPFQEPSEFNSVIDEQFVLVIGRAGLGKSRTLIEAVEEIAGQAKFDIVVVISGKIDEPADLDSLARTNVDDDVLLIWDDLHQVMGDQVVNNSIDRLKNEFDRKGIDLHVRAAVRSEHIDAVLPENWGIEELRQPADPHGQYPIWGEFKPVELESFDVENLNKFVRHALEYHELTADDDVVESFVERALEADPTPFYIDTICKTTTGNEITQSDISQLPESALTSWKTAYKELADDGMYGDAHKVLHTLSILDALNISSDEILVEDVFYEVFDGSNFKEQIDFLKNRGWIITQPVDFDTTRFIIHDVRLEAIAGYFSLKNRRRDIRSLSNFLQKNDFNYYNGDLGAILNTRFSEYIFDKRASRRPVQIAKQHFERAIELNDETPSVYVKYARFLEKQNNPEKADEMYKQAINLSPRDLQLRDEYIAVTTGRGNYDQARNQWEQVLEINPSNSRFRSEYAWHLAQQDEHKEACKQFEQAIEYELKNEDETGIKNIRAFDSYISYLNKMDRHEKISELYKKAIDVEPNNIELRRNYIRHLSDQRENKKINKQFKKSVDIDSKNVQLRQEYANFLDEQDKNEEVRKQYEIAIGIEPGQTNRLYAQYLAEQSDHKKAHDQYQKAINTNPEDAALRRDYAEYLADQNEYQRAQEQFNKCLNTTNIHVIESFSNFLDNQEIHNAICEKYEEAINNSPDSVFIRMYYANYLAKNGGHKEARNQYEEALKIGSARNVVLSKYLQYLVEQEKNEEARKRFKQAIDTEPGDLSYRWKYAKFLAEQDDHKEAQKQFEEAISMQPHSWGLHIDYAEYLAEQTKYKQARKEYEQAIEAGVVKNRETKCPVPSCESKFTIAEMPNHLESIHQ